MCKAIQRRSAYNHDMVFVLIAALWLAGCSSNKASTAGPPPAPLAPVSVSKAALKAVPFELQGVGNVEAYSTVTVKAQIGGELTLVDFAEGANVKKGDRLFVIDPRPYQAQVAQAEATLVRDRAQLKAAEANLARDTAQEEYARSQSRRVTELAQQGVAPKDSAEQANAQARAAAEAIRADQAAIDSARANSTADEAALERAKLQLEYCTIRSPIDGRTGHLQIKQGNVVKANDVDLVTINQLQPIYVTFAVPESNLALIKGHMSNGKVPVSAYPEGDSGVAQTGTLNFVENTVDSATGTIRLKALFQNNGAQLWPGQFVRVVIRMNVAANSIVAPTAAVQTGQDGKFVFVVKPDMTVESRPVTTGRTLDREVVIDKGLTEDENVVTAGQLRLISGSRVQIKSN